MIQCLKDSRLETNVHSLCQLIYSFKLRFFSLLIKTIKFGDEKINESLSKYVSYYWEFQLSKFS